MKNEKAGNEVVSKWMAYLEVNSSPSEWNVSNEQKMNNLSYEVSVITISK